MNKICVFCGENPISKTKEHVIPDWLIGYTGEPNRLAHFGINLQDKRERVFSFDQFIFPACKECNLKFSKLEEECRHIIIDMLKEKAISDRSLSKILTWFDKIRIGIWLGLLYLNKNPFGIKPHFHIKSRVDTADRMLLIYKSNTRDKRITITGTFLPFFHHYPSCFGLIINQFYFINLSSDFLFSRRIGLPFPQEVHIIEDNKKQEWRLGAILGKGLNHTILPLLRTYYNQNCTEIFQPIVNLNFLAHSDISNLYKNDYTKKFIDLNNSNIGKVLIKQNGKLIPYSSINQSSWIPATSFNENQLHKIFSKTVLSFQNFLIDQTLNYFPKNEPQERWRLIKKINNITINRL